MSEQFQPNWPLVRISDLAEINIGGTPSRAAQQFWATKPEGNPWIAISDLKDKYVDDTKEYITDLGARCSNVKLIEPFTTVMSFKLTVGRTAITTRPMYCNEAIAIFSPKNDALSAGWLYHALPRAALSVVTDNAVKGATLNKAKMAEMTVQLPPITEQREIAKVLDTLDTAIRETEALIEKLKAVKQGLLHDLLTRGIDANGQLRPPQSEAPQLYKESPLGWIPREWDALRLDAVAARGSGHTPSKDVPSYWNGGVKWVSLADSHRLDRIYIHETDKEISELGIANSSAVLHPEGTVILSRDAGIGKSAILGCDMAVSQHFMAWRCGEKLNNLFLYFYLQREKPRFEAIAMGSTIKTIGLPFFKSYEIAVPPRREQDQAAAILMETEQDLLAHAAELEKLRQQKIGLMDDLLTGRVRVTPLLESVQQPAAQTGA